MSADITKHTGTLHQYDPPIRFVVIGLETSAPHWAFYFQDERGSMVAHDSVLIAEAMSQIEKDKA